jgi:hypothetical protein
LADAREQRHEAAKLRAKGIDPIEHRKEQRATEEAAALATAKAITFREAAERYIAMHEPTWRNAKHRQQWRNTLANYVYPSLGDVPVRDIDHGLIRAVLEKIWVAKPETASRARSDRGGARLGHTRISSG